ncbi:STAS domain-containing protein [Dermatobacter hominis]|uniref:STAS domain-containing protein n=1 Tax=Dermatobacter hominis TaxID=2884263 RepID=UPI001D10DD8C|nr:STAS domain-containing protein [Dermatobacter hominis]UDY37581.1 STAS domain-containing protein [Dermatobacter hominis]
MDISTQTAVLDDGPVVIAVGELDLASTPAFTAALTEALVDERQTLTIDLSGVTFCDSTGLRALLTAPGHRPVRLRAPTTSVRRLLDLTDTTERFEILP